jgi:hypothetical protein
MEQCPFCGWNKEKGFTVFIADPRFDLIFSFASDKPLWYCFRGSPPGVFQGE